MGQANYFNQEDGDHIALISGIVGSGDPTIIGRIAAGQRRIVMSARLQKFAAPCLFALGAGLLCLVLTSCAREGRRSFSSEPSIVPTVNVVAYEDLSRLAGFTVIAPSYLPTGLNSEPEYSYIPDLQEAELYFAGVLGSPMALDISESLDPNRAHCPPCPQLRSTYDQETVLGQQVLLARFPSEESRSRILAYFWLRDVFVTLVIRHENVAIALPSQDDLEAEILRIAESMIAKAG